MITPNNQPAGYDEFVAAVDAFSQRTIDCLARQVSGAGFDALQAARGDVAAARASLLAMWPGTKVDKPAPTAGSAAVDDGLWLVQLARDTDEACAWERAFDHLILKMSRQGRLVGDEPERLGFLVRRGVQLMRQDRNEKIDDAQRDDSGASGSAGQSDHGVLRLPPSPGAPASGVDDDDKPQENKP